MSSPPFSPPVALASLSGIADADWALAVADHVGAAVLGGVALDEPTREAARSMVDRGREEFLPENPFSFVDRQLRAVAAEAPDLLSGVNVRATTPEATRAAAAVCARHGAILEVNAHCRQTEMCAIGCGESLLRDVDRLEAHIREAAATGATVSVKVRTEVNGVDLAALAGRVGTAGADIVHIDAMDSEGVVADVVETTDAVVIANNGVRDRETVREYLALGADAVSVGRPSDDPVILERVRRATVEWYADPV